MMGDNWADDDPPQVADDEDLTENEGRFLVAVVVFLVIAGAGLWVVL